MGSPKQKKESLSLFFSFLLDLMMVMTFGDHGKGNKIGKGESEKEYLAFN